MRLCGHVHSYRNCMSVWMSVSVRVITSVYLSDTTYLPDPNVHTSIASVAKRVLLEWPPHVICLNMQDRGTSLASNQIQYSLLYRVPEQNGVKQACEEGGTSVIAYSPLAQGLLTGQPHFLTFKEPSLLT